MNIESNQAEGSFIGPSTGWISAKISPEIKDHNNLLNDCPASAVEVVCIGEERPRVMLQDSLAEDLGYRSMHLDSYSDYEEALTEKQLTAMRQLAELWILHDFHGTSAHPDTIPSHMYAKFFHAGLTIGIENMDRHKSFGQSVADVLKVLQAHTGVSGVIDLQHAYEYTQDNGIELNEFVKALVHIMEENGGLKHLHVSGELTVDGVQQLPHAQLTMASNRDVILDALGVVLASVKHPPAIILEGDPLSTTSYMEAGQRLVSNKKQGLLRAAKRNISSEIDLVKEAFPERVKVSS